MAKISARGSKEVLRVQCAPREVVWDGVVQFQTRDEFLLRSDRVVLTRSRIVAKAHQPKERWSTWKVRGRVPAKVDMDPNVSGAWLSRAVANMGFDVDGVRNAK